MAYEQQTTYTAENLAIYSLEPGQVWRAWKNQEITVGAFVAWQDRHKYYFNEFGGRILARQLFHRLERDSFTRGRYIVLNDGNFLAGFYADNDADAIRIFETGEYKNDKY